MWKCLLTGAAGGALMWTILVLFDRIAAARRLRAGWERARREREQDQGGGQSATSGRGR